MKRDAEIDNHFIKCKEMFHNNVCPFVVIPAQVVQLFGEHFLFSFWRSKVFFLCVVSL